MEQKNRLIIAIVITVLIVAAMFTSFGRGLFMKDMPQIVLPASDASQGEPGASTSGNESGSQSQRVEVTTGTVQSVIGSLSRGSSYYRDLTVENFWGEGLSSAFTVQTWVDGGWSHSIQTLPSGLIRHDLVGDGQVYYWYDGDQTWRTAPADQLSADLAQHIPTYETVLALDPNSITAAGYELKGELPCIYVQVHSAVAGYEERYWVSVDNGLLVCAESLEDGELVYRMTAFTPISSPCPVEADTFALPDGTVLHSP